MKKKKLKDPTNKFSERYLVDNSHRLKLRDQHGNNYAVIKQKLTKGRHERLLFLVVHKGDMTEREKRKIRSVA